MTDTTALLTEGDHIEVMLARHAWNHPDSNGDFTTGYSGTVQTVNAVGIRLVADAGFASVCRMFDYCGEVVVVPWASIATVSLLGDETEEG